MLNHHSLHRGQALLFPRNVQRIYEVDRVLCFAFDHMDIKVLTWVLESLEVLHLRFQALTHDQNDAFGARLRPLVAARLLIVPIGRLILVCYLRFGDRTTYVMNERLLLCWNG
jgi:hypothetical protein